MKLAQMSRGQSGKILGIELEPASHLRLMELGFRHSSILKVVEAPRFAGKVITLSGQRFALDSKTASCIEVTTDLSATDVN